MVDFDLAQHQERIKPIECADDNGAILLLRTQLLKAVKAELERKSWTHEQAAQKLGVQRPRITEIYGLKINKFGVELLVKYLHRLNKEVTFQTQSPRL